MRFPVAFPIYDADQRELVDGYQVDASNFCKQRIAKADSACLAHYSALLSAIPRGFVMCPHGFTSYCVPLSSGRAILTGFVASPRFDDAKQRERAKSYPTLRVSREAVETMGDSLLAMDIEWQRIQEETRRQLPQALHELRKLNAIVKQGAERLLTSSGNADDAENVAGAAHLMSNIFEIVEVLTNLEDVHVAVSQRLEFIAVFDLAYKAKKIYSVRAKLKPIHIWVGGDDSVGVLGSKKYFPLIMQILLENAIKYGVRTSRIEIQIDRDASDCVISVRNEVSGSFDTVACFDKGRRFADPDAEGDGLGLYLAREVVRAHGGRIECVLHDGFVTFTVRVPAHIERKVSSWR